MAAGNINISQRARWFMLTTLLTFSLGSACFAGPATQRYVYIASQEGNTVSTIDVQTNKVVSRIGVPEKPVFIAVTSDGSSAYVTHPDLARISVLDLNKGSVVAEYHFSGEPFAATLSSDEASLFVSDWKGNAVVRIDVQNGKETGRISVGSAPAGLTLDPACRRLYVADRGSAAVSVIDAIAWKSLYRVPVGASPFALAAHDGQIYVANVKDNTLSRLETESRHETWRVKMEAMPYGVAITPDGRQAWVTAQQKGMLQRIDTDGTVVRPGIKVGRYPEGVVIADGRAYVALWFDDKVAVVDLATGQVSKKIDVDAGPRIVATRSLCKKQ